jgi:3-hydroxyacyl-CoA dehydrogenase
MRNYVCHSEHDKNRSSYFGFSKLTIVHTETQIEASAMRLWAEGVATAEEIELGIQTTFGFRMPHEGPFLHYDLAGIWKWPADSGNPRRRAPEPPPSEEITQKIRARGAEKKPWFVDPEKFDEAIEKRDREYIRRLKTLYGSDEK